MKYHLFLIHYIFETRSTTTSCHMCVVFCWSSCPFPEKNTAWANDQNIPRILGEAPTSRSILMKNWCQADPDPMLRWGGATEHGPMGRNLQGGVQQRRGFDKNEESKMTTPDFGELWVAGSTAENHVRGDNGTLWFAVRPLGVYLDIEDVCPSTIWSWQKLAISIRIWSVCCCGVFCCTNFWYRYIGKAGSARCFVWRYLLIAISFSIPGLIEHRWLTVGSNMFFSPVERCPSNSQV